MCYQFSMTKLSIGCTEHSTRFTKQKKIEWDLRVSVVQWPYRTICKNLSAEMIPKVKNRVEPNNSEGNTKRNLHIITPIVMTARED